MNLTNIIGIFLGLIVFFLGVIAFVRYKKVLSDNKYKNADQEVNNILNEANLNAEKIKTKAVKESQDIISKSRASFENEMNSKRNNLNQIEEKLIQKEKYIDQKDLKISQKEDELSQELERIKDIKKKQENVVNELIEKLEKTAGFSKEEAKDILLKNVEREIKDKAGKMIKDIEDEAKKVANKKAKEIVVNAIQKTAIDSVSNNTTSTVELPDDEMKGRIIGKEGRNIRVFESLTGVDVIIDDTPNAVTLSCFNPIRRQIATLTLQKLVDDGRIHPTKIEEAIEKSTKEVDELILEKGEWAAQKVNLKFSNEIVKLLGRLHFRTSYGQNQLLHAIESAVIAKNIAQQLNVDVALATRGALIHDIGKALDFEIGGSHDDIGKEVCERNGESKELINCIMAHHEDEEPETIEAVIVMMADAISSARPGARRESVDTYLKRLEKLELIANSFEGVEKAYAIQAGREIRVIVKPELVNDDSAHKLAFDIAKQIEEDMDYPGEIKVSIIRETRATEFAR